MTTDINILTELLGTLSGLLYVYLEIVQKRFMWVVGALSAFVYILIFGAKGLYGATLLQIYFLVMSIYGWITWGRENKKTEAEQKSSNSVRKINGNTLLSSAIFSVCSFVVLFLILKSSGKDPMPAPDALATVLSIVATYWVARRYRENWLLWIAVNGISLYIYISQGLYPTSVLYAIYIFAAVAGYRHWRKFNTIVA